MKMSPEDQIEATKALLSVLMAIEQDIEVSSPYCILVLLQPKTNTCV